MSYSNRYADSRPAIDDEACVGLFSPCFAPVRHHLKDPDSKLSIPLCEEHWQWAMDLEQKLSAEPEFRDQFALAVDKAKAGGEQ